MKKLTKVITAAGLAAVLGVSAIAAGQLIPINVDPSIKILVNGEEFKPTDANGNEVMTFSYEGTTYAPLRALAEAYGLEVGYDAEKKMATVAEPETETAETEENTADGAETSSQKALEDAEFFIKLGGNISRNAIKSRLSYLGYSEERRGLCRRKPQIRLVDTRGNQCSILCRLLESREGFFISICSSTRDTQRMRRTS